MLNFIKRHWPTALATLLLLTALTGVYAKYVTDQIIQGQASISASLGLVKIWEHEGRKKDDGSYVLTGLPTGTCDEAAHNGGNMHSHVPSTNYTVVIPGLDIPKDTFVRITDNTTVPMYVFLEVVSTLEPKITFTIDDANWMQLIGASPKHGGTVYVYTTDGANPTALTPAVDPTDINILKNQQVIVHDHLLHDTPKNLGITFYATITDTSLTPAEAYNAAPTP